MTRAAWLAVARAAEVFEQHAWAGRPVEAAAAQGHVTRQGGRPLDDLGALDIDLVDQPDATESIAQLHVGIEAAQAVAGGEGFPDGDAARVAKLVAELESGEVVEKVRGHRIHRERQIPNFGGDAGAGDGFGGNVLAGRARRDAELRQRNDIGLGRRGHRGGCPRRGRGLGGKRGGESEADPAHTRDASDHGGKFRQDEGKGSGAICAAGRCR